MTKRVFILAAGILAVSGMMLLSTGVVHADKPFVEEFEFTDNGQPVGDCGDFLILAEGSGTGKLTTYFDRNGDPSRLLFQGRYRGTLTNSVTGFQLTDDPSVANIFVDLTTDTQTNVGTFYNITLPGQGVVLFETGRIVFGEGGFPTFIAGPHLPPDTQFDIICDALDH